MHPVFKNTYVFTAIGAIVLGALLYGGKQYLAARELARLEENRIEGGWYETPVSFEGAWHLVPPGEIYSSGIEEGDIPALTQPNLMSVDEADDVIADDLGGIAVEIQGKHRFYPVQIMNWHEVVHDTIGGESVLVYYGPLTGAAAVYRLPENMRFVVSGRGYNNDILLKQEGTETLWSGILGMPVVSSREADLDASLERLPSSFMTWKEWRDAHPDGTVLSTDTGHARDYTRHPYGNYENSVGVYFPVNRTTYSVRAKEPAYLVQSEGAFGVFVKTATILDETPSVLLGDACIVGLHEASGSQIFLYSCEVNGRTLTFRRVEPGVFTDEETGSRWNASGRAVSGELTGAQLTVVPSVRLYSFIADALFPQAVIAGEEFVLPQTLSEDEISSADNAPVIEGENVDGATVEVVQ
jgi:hypothetical protein